MDQHTKDMDAADAALASTESALRTALRLLDKHGHAGQHAQLQRAREMIREITPTKLIQVTWISIDAATYHEKFNVLPPAAYSVDSFLLGTATDHAGPNGAARFDAYRYERGEYFKGSHPLTIQQFRAL